MKQAQEKHLLLENENEDLRKQIVARDRKLKEMHLLNEELNEEQCKHIAALEEKLNTIESGQIARKEEQKKAGLWFHFSVQLGCFSLIFVRLETDCLGYKYKLKWRVWFSRYLYCCALVIYKV